MGRKLTDVQGSAQRRGESPEETLDRNVDELLQETRVATAGVQFLFAFLLTLPFTQRFGSLSDLDTTLYTVTLLSTTFAAIVMIAPVSFHRVLFRQHEKQAMVTFADRSLLAGLALLLIGISTSVLLVLDVVLGRGPAIAGCAAATVLGVALWFALPAWRRTHSTH